MDTLAVRTQGQISASLSRKWEHHLIFACFKDSLGHIGMESKSKVFSTIGSENAKCLKKSSAVQSSESFKESISRKLFMTQEKVI